MSNPRHVPVLLDRVVALLRARARRTTAPCWSTPRSASAATPRPCSSAVPGWPGSSASTATRRPWRWPAQRLAGFGDRFTGVHAVYDELPDVLADLGLASVDAVLFDLGVSSMQLDVRERGFAYAEDAPLDMRMDPTTGPTAADVLNTYSAAELTRVLREYGEERFARKIAAAVVREREREPFTTLRPAWSSCCTPRSRRRPGVPAGTRPSAPSRPCAWRSTTSWPCCAGPCPPRSTRSRSAAASSSSPTTPWRTGWSSRPSPPPPAATSPLDLPFVPEGSEPALRLVTRGAERADADEIDAQPARRLGPAARRRTSPPRPRSRPMSSPASRSARAGPAPRRGRRRARPPHRRPAAPGRAARCRS